ncbi:hypothetical protein [Clostridium thailandense]|uniref:hypothetical protein n=1 Tax=Clostridium thailandense TaxID=2794346 RepID=UPI003989128D
MNSSKSAKNATLQYAFLQSMLWGNFGVLICYAGKYCLAQGLTNTQYGVIFGVVSGSAFILQILLAQIIGNGTRRYTLRRVILFEAGITFICGVLLYTTSIHGYFAVSLIALMCILLQTYPAIIDSFGMEKIQTGMVINLGMARGCGSFAYSILTYLCGWCIMIFGIKAVPFIGSLLALALFYGTWSFPKGKAETNQKLIDSSRKEKLWNIRFVLALTGFFLLYASHNFLCNYMYQIVVTRSGNESTLGTVTAFGAMLELPAMFLIVNLMKVKRCDFWLKISGVFITMKALIYFISNSMTGLYIAQLMQLGGFSLFSISAVYYIGSTVSLENSIHGQTYRAAACTFSNLLAYFLGGVVCDYFGPQAVIICSIVCGLTGSIILFLSCYKVDKVVGL